MIMIGVDFGDRRVGFAVCGKDEKIAVSIRTENVRGAKDAASKTVLLAKERGAEKIVVGMPERADGYRGERCEKTEVYLSFLREMTGIPVETQDERFTTVQAHDLLYAAGLSGKEHKKCVDALSAQLILQSYLDGKRQENCTK